MVSQAGDDAQQPRVTDGRIIEAECRERRVGPQPLRKKCQRVFSQMLQADKQVLLAGVKRSALELRQKEVAPLRSRLASFPRSPI